MSVLRHLIHEREIWSYRQRFIAAHHSHAKIREYMLIISVGVFLYFYHEKVLLFIKSLLN